MELYRVVVVSRRNIDALPIVSTREGLQYIDSNDSTQSSISWLAVVVGRRWVVFPNPLMELYRLVVVSRYNIDPLPIDSTKSPPTIRCWSPKSTFQIQIFNRRVTMRQPFESSFQAQSDQCINTARSPCGRTRNYTSLNATPSMIIVTTKILKSDHAEQVRTWWVDCSAVMGINTARPPCGRPRERHLQTSMWSMTVGTSASKKTLDDNRARSMMSWHMYRPIINGASFSLSVELAITLLLIHQLDWPRLRSACCCWLLHSLTPPTHTPSTAAVTTSQQCVEFGLEE